MISVRRPLMKFLCLVYITLLAQALSGVALCSSHEGVEFFETKIRPLLAAQCFACHGQKLQMAGLNLSTAAAFLKGNEKGPIVSKEDPQSSRILEVIGYEGKIKMPPSGKLEEMQIADLKAWVKMGAPWPEAEVVPNTVVIEKKDRFTQADREFWAFQPVKHPALPVVKNKAWLKSPIDGFILGRMEEKGISPAGPAGKLTLLRRATYDLTGLPPTEREIQDFLADNSLDAYSKVVDRLLASPRYGERWGRHWLDVARFAESTGADEDRQYPHAWRYRDYVINAFNRDLPYDRFITEQLAGDLLQTDGSVEVNVNGIVATGFLALGPKPIAQQDKVKMVYDVIDEQIDVTSKAFLGLTVSCARCHDHKFDPISTRDYYSLASIFASTRSFKKVEGTVSQLYFEPLVPKEAYGRYEQHQKKISARKSECDKIIEEEAARYASRLRLHLAEYMVASWKVYQTGASAASLSRQQGLDEAVLERWVEYLKPDGELKPHLEHWRQAEASNVSAIAEEYQSHFEKAAREWEEVLRNWKKKVEEAAKNKMELPETPKFDGGKDRFFSEVSFGSKEPGTGKLVHPGPLALPEKEQESLFEAESRQKLSVLRQEMEELKKTSPPEPPMACAVADGETIEQHVFIRGSHENRGEVVSKGFPRVLSNDGQLDIKKGSGRLELAKWLTNPNHPLTSRVMANRIWQWHFGEGLVRTPSNYGRTGIQPTHPELLDYLAKRFIESGWSIKAMHRLIMLSSAYQMSSQITEEKTKVDPANEFWSRFNRRRLTVEEIRDSFLNLDGVMDLTMGGPLQAYSDNEDGNNRPSFDLPQNKRRTVYLPLRRSNLFSLLNLFDFGDATNSNSGRTRTNVAPQALFMMNSDFVNERSLNFTEYLLKQADRAEPRIEQAYLVTLARKPTAVEIQNAIRYISSFPAKSSRHEASTEAWQSFCRVLMSSNEFIYVD